MTAKARKSLSPKASACPTAPLSAQIVAPMDAFSKLHPCTMRPEPVSNAAPTLKFEYGTYARSRTSVAACNSRNIVCSFNDSFVNVPDLLVPAYGTASPGRADVGQNRFLRGPHASTRGFGPVLVSEQMQQPVHEQKGELPLIP